MNEIAEMQVSNINTPIARALMDIEVVKAVVENKTIRHISTNPDAEDT